MNQAKLFDDIADEYLTLIIAGCTLLPEWDILSKVPQTREEIDLKAKWIQSHQDDKKPFRS